MFQPPLLLGIQKHGPEQMLVTKNCIGLAKNMTCLIIIEQMPVHQLGEVSRVLGAAVGLDPGPPCLVLRLLDGVELGELSRSQRAHVPSRA